MDITMGKCKTTTIKRLILSVLLITTTISCHEKTAEEELREISLKFANLYYNLQPRKARIYCEEEVQMTMNYQQKCLTEQEYDLYEKIGPARVSYIRCEIPTEDLFANVFIRIENFVCIDYQKDSAFVDECDTVMLYFFKDFYRDRWYIYGPY